MITCIRELEKALLEECQNSGKCEVEVAGRFDGLHMISKSSCRSSVATVYAHENGIFDGVPFDLAAETLAVHPAEGRDVQGVQLEEIPVDTGWRAGSPVPGLAEIVIHLACVCRNGVPWDLRDARVDIADQPVNPCANRCIRIIHYECKAPGSRWYSIPGQMG